MEERIPITGVSLLTPPAPPAGFEPATSRLTSEVTTSSPLLKRGIKMWYKALFQAELRGHIYIYI